MRRPLDTIRRRRPWALPTVLIGAAALATSLVGFAEAPYSESRAARGLVEGAVLRQDLLRRQRQIALELEEGGTLQRLDELVGALHHSLPSGPDEVRVFYLIHLVAHALAMELDELIVGEPEAQSLIAGDEDVGQRVLALRGRAKVQALFDLVEALRVAGHPLAVLDVRITCEQGEVVAASLFEESVAFSMSLGLFERAPAAPKKQNPESGKE